MLQTIAMHYSLCRLWIELFKFFSLLLAFLCFQLVSVCACVRACVCVCACAWSCACACVCLSMPLKVTIMCVSYHPRERSWISAPFFFHVKIENAADVMCEAIPKFTEGGQAS